MDVDDFACYLLCVAAEIYAMHNILSSFMLRCDIALAPLTQRLRWPPMALGAGRWRRPCASKTPKREAMPSPGAGRLKLSRGTRLEGPLRPHAHGRHSDVIGASEGAS